MTTTRCRGCGSPLTWSNRRKQYNRLIRNGLTPEQAKFPMPRCQKCLTRWLKETFPGRMYTMMADGLAKRRRQGNGGAL